MRSESHREPIWVVTGPTASGKSSLALAIAERTGREIASMDSMAVYRRMDIGTAKPAAAERQRVPHHLIDLVDPDQGFDTARWCAAAESLLERFGDDRSRLLFVGGTPLYLMAFFKGMLDGPSADPALRDAMLRRELETPGTLHAELEHRDPIAAGRIHRNDTKRLVRALEFVERTGRPISGEQVEFERPGWRRPCRILSIERDREDLRARIRARTDAMLDDGLLDEVRSIRDDCGFSPQSAAAIGYAECLRHLEKPFKDREELRNRIRRSTHRLVRRQATWLRRIDECIRFAPEDGVDAAIALLERDDALRG